MKRLIWTALVLFSFLVYNSTSSNEVVKIKVCKVIEHEALNSVVRGMTDYLNSQKGKKYEVVVETCQGQIALASQIIAKFVGSNADVIVTIGTVPSQAAYKFTKNKQTKVVFSSVTNPADIASDFSNSNMTGVSNFVDLKPQLELFRQIQPNLNKLGMIYNTGEANSSSIIERIKPICENMGIQLIVQGISKISELPQALEKTQKGVDAVFISNDNMALSGMETIVETCAQNNIPVYVSDTDQVEKGCVAALGPNQYNIGVQTGKLVQQIAEGKDINNIKIQYPDTTELYVNTKSVLKIPDSIIEQAKKVYEVKK
ncbi:MAG: ABC transporter substrate-binding protein [Alphaproteobacteria bacterium]|nr:ABC transporter substrate-binding protein [Alphaproteobacteria bacterium]